jgi:hypothetical protein
MRAAASAEASSLRVRGAPSASVFSSTLLAREKILASRSSSLRRAA